MDSTKYIGMDVHKDAMAVAVMNSAGKVVMESILETQAATLLQFIRGSGGTCWSPWKKGPGRLGCTICSSRRSPRSRCAIPARTLC